VIAREGTEPIGGLLVGWFDAHAGATSMSTTTPETSFASEDSFASARMRPADHH
jgi:hypothetical protein